MLLDGQTDQWQFNAYGDDMRFLESAPPVATFAEAIAPAAAGLPVLNSLPGAPTAIYLDFDGDAGTNTEAYDEDGDPTSFNASEQANITQAWRHVSAYFSMFNTNVTTVRPTVPMAYGVIGNNAGGTTGGYAFLNTFPSTTPMAFNHSGNARDRMTAIAHEIGHVFGLGHQSTYDLLGNKTAEYASETDPLLGPMMGVDYAGMVHKWLNGHPSGSAADLQDDVRVIADKIKAYGGDGFRPDDHSGAPAAATAMTASAGAYSASGVIERLSDVDVFSFSTTGANLSILAAPSYPSPVDLKFEVYSGNTLLAASDGEFNPQQVTMTLGPGTYYVAVMSHGDYGDLGSYELTIRPLATGWADEDIGLTSIAGYARQEASNKFTIGASGADIWDRSDSFNFAYQKLTGNGTIVARLTRVDDTDPWAKAGVMIRETLAAGSKDVGMMGTPQSGPQMLWRNAAGGETTGYWSGAAAFTPTWLKLERSGSTFRGYRSSDGQNYTLWSTTTVTMTPTVFVGLALTSHNQSRFNTASFENVSITGKLGEDPPVYNGLAAPGGLNVSVGAGSGLSLSWASVPGATGYAVDRSSDGVVYSRAGTTTGATAYQDENLFGSLRYFYRVSALNAAGASPSSEVRSVVNRPSASTGVTITSLSMNTLVINWKDASGDIGYRVERSTNGVDFSNAGTVGKNVPSFTDRNLTAGTVYRYRVIALSNQGDSSPSAVASGSTRLLAVGGLSFAVVEPRRIVIRWNDISGEQSYKIERSTNGTDFSEIGTASANANNYVDTTVQPLTEYYYRVVGVAPTTIGENPSAIFAATPAGTPLPGPWTAADVGNVAGRGATGFAGGKFTLIGSGNDIWGNADGFHFASQPVIGDGEIVAKVSAVEDTDGWAKIGLMFREGPAAGARHAMLMITPGNGLNLQYRSGVNAASQSAGALGGEAPQWLKLVREGNRFSGYASADGNAWTLVGTVNIAMTTTLLVGFAVSSHSSSLLNTVTFENVSWSNRAPMVTKAPTAAPNPVTGTTTELSAVGNDDHSEANLTYTWAATSLPAGAPQPTFSVNGTNAAKVTTATFHRAGAYTFTVTIADAGGLKVQRAVDVVVAPTLTSLRVEPASVELAPGANWQFAVAFADQFSQPLPGTPNATWAVSAGGGTITSDGLYTAPATAGTSMIAATAGSLTGAASVTISTLGPVPPTNFAATIGLNGTMRFTWTDNSDDEDGFRIERSVDGSGFTVLATVGSNETSAVEATPAVGASLYRLVAFDGAFDAPADRLLGRLLGDSGADTFTVSRDAVSGDVKLASNGATAETAPLDRLGQVFAIGNAGDDQLVLNLSGGVPFGAAGILFDGGENGTAAGDLLRVEGSDGDDTVLFASGRVTVGDASVQLWRVEGQRAALGAGNDALAISGMAYRFDEDVSFRTDNLHLTIAGGSVLFTATQHLAALTLQSGAAILAPGGDKLIVTRELAIAEGSRLDLADNDLVLRASADARQGAYEDLVDQVRTAREAGWAGAGLSSSSARQSSLTGLAVLLNDVGGGRALMASLDSEPVGLNDVLVKYTWNGDTDGNGKVDADDYFRIDQGLLRGLDGWRNGNFDLAGGVDADDYQLIDNAFFGQSRMLATQPAAAVAPPAVKDKSSSAGVASRADRTFSSARKAPAPTPIGHPHSARAEREAELRGAGQPVVDLRVTPAMMSRIFSAAYPRLHRQPDDPAAIFHGVASVDPDPRPSPR